MIPLLAMILRLLPIFIITTVKVSSNQTSSQLVNETTNILVNDFVHNSSLDPIVVTNKLMHQFISVLKLIHIDLQTMDKYFNYNAFYYWEPLMDIVYTDNKIRVWMLSVVCCLVIGVSAMLPLVVISFSNNNCLINSDSSPKTLLKYVLSFAVGSLLGDVFLHLLPEASHHMLASGISARNVQLYLGIWTLIGILCFAFTESFFSHINQYQQNTSHSTDNHRNTSHNNHLNQHNSCNSNGKLTANSKHICDEVSGEGEATKVGTRQAMKANITGYLNLLANAFDNLTHGVAVGASFLVSVKMGLLTTFAIAIHEIPHEIGDFAILIKSGFNKWQAVRAQISIAGVTVLGTLIILLADSADVVGHHMLWILPFTSGAFLYISLVSILPELLSEPDFSQSIRQTLFILCGLSVMAFVNLIAD